MSEETSASDHEHEALQQNLGCSAGIEGTLLILQCKIASVGHPNVKGGQAVGDAIVGRLKAGLPVWKKRYAP